MVGQKVYKIMDGWMFGWIDGWTNGCLDEIVDAGAKGKEISGFKPSIWVLEAADHELAARQVS